MKKPLVILTTLAVVSASAVAFFEPPPAGGPPSGTNQKVDGLAKGGLMSPAQAEMLKKMQAAAAGRAAETNSVMSDPSKQSAMGHSGAQNLPAGSVGGPAGQASPPPPPPPPPAPKIPGWRLEGTAVGGKAKPSAIFMIEGWGQVEIHVGEKLNEITKVVAIRGNQVTLRTKDKKTLRVTPW